MVGRSIPNAQNKRRGAYVEELVLFFSWHKIVMSPALTSVPLPDVSVKTW